MIRRLNESGANGYDVDVLERAIQKLKNAMVECLDSFNEVDSEFLNKIISPDYPFDESFDELVYNVMMWSDGCERRLADEIVSYENRRSSRVSESSLRRRNRRK